MSPVFVLIVLLGVALTAEAIIRIRLRYAGRGLDVPGERSLHSRPTPHGGGLGIVAAVVVAGISFSVSLPVLAALSLLAVVSIVDDWRPLPFWLRLAVHILAAASVVFLHADMAVGSFLVTTLLIAWAANAYNFMDGADGLAGSMAAIGFSAYAFGLWRGGEQGFALLCVAVVLSSLLFLRHNWHPARIFMGDVGSVPLGFLAGVLGWIGVMRGVWPVWFPVMVFSPFLLDATATLLRRVARGEAFWRAHRDHYYQRMVRMGGSHAEVCRRWIGLMLLASVMAVAATEWLEPGGWLMLGAWIVLVGWLGRSVDKSWRECSKE